MRENMASRTAEYMALFRALESARPRGLRLFEDPLARKFLGWRLALLARLSVVPGLREARPLAHRPASTGGALLGGRPDAISR